MANENALDILKIQKTIRKAIRDYQIKARYGEEVLISVLSVDLWMNLTEEEFTNSQPKPKTKKSPDTPEDAKALHAINAV